MNPITISTPSASSTTVTTTSTSTVTTSSTTSSPVQAFHVLEISLISAQDLAQVSKSMRTYAVAWIHPNHKRTTRVDQHGHNNPTWNDRIAFRVDHELLYSDEAAVTVEIHTVSWFRDVLVGTVRVLMSDLITPYARNSTRFVALQIRRPSGIAQGKLNMGVAKIKQSKMMMMMMSSKCLAKSSSGDHIVYLMLVKNFLQKLALYAMVQWWTDRCATVQW